MKFNRYINLDNGFTADIAKDTVIPPCYKVLLCVDINIQEYNEEINTLPCYLVAVPLKELYQSKKNHRIVLKEWYYE